MRVIKNNYVKSKSSWFPAKVMCKKCNSVFEFDEEDITNGVYGMAEICCPCCGINLPLYELTTEEKAEDYEEEITIDNLKFPNHFYNSSGGSDISDKEIEEEIKRNLKWLTQHPEEQFRFSASRNCFVFIYKGNDEDEYEVYVTKDYYDTFVKAGRSVVA